MRVTVIWLRRRRTWYMWPLVSCRGKWLLRTLGMYSRILNFSTELILIKFGTVGLHQTFLGRSGLCSCQGVNSYCTFFVHIEPYFLHTHTHTHSPFDKLKIGIYWAIQVLLRFEILSDFQLLVHYISNNSAFPEICMFEYLLAFVKCVLWYIMFTVVHNVCCGT